MKALWTLVILSSVLHLSDCNVPPDVGVGRREPRRDLQLGGSDTIRNMWPLDSSVNWSLGAQIQQQIKNLPPGTKINRVTIGHR